MFTPILISLAKKTTNKLDNEIVYKILRPIELIISISFLTVITPLLPLEEVMQDFLLQVEKTFYALVGLWLVFRMIDVFTDRKIAQLNKKGKIGAANVFPLLRRAVKTVLVSVLLLFLLQNFGVDIAALLAGLGIGGLAIALAGQKTIENLFGGVVIVLDQPAKVGDYCKVGADEAQTKSAGGINTTISRYIGVSSQRRYYQ